MVETLVRRRKNTWLVKKKGKVFEANAKKRVWLRNSSNKSPKIKGLRFLKVIKLPNKDIWELTLQEANGILIMKRVAKSSDDVSKMASKWMNDSRDEGFYTTLVFPKGYIQQLRAIQKKAKIKG